MTKKIIGITILDDSEFYSRLLLRQLRNYTDIISAQREIVFEINSFINPTDFINNLRKDTDIVFIDFYLGNTTAMDLIETIKKQCTNCKIIVISQVRNELTSLETIKKGAIEYIYKDQNALARSCFIVEDLINNKTPFYN
jgi:DNA-binding NarL/FixJ family response regulator